MTFCMTIYKEGDGYSGNINGSDIHTLTLESLKKEIDIALDKYVEDNQ